MSTVERKAWHCDECGFEWLKTDGVTPSQCPSRKCRKRSWNKGEASADNQGDSSVRVLPAGEYESYTEGALEHFWHACWKVTPQSDRYGYRLEGPVLEAKTVIEKRSHGIVPGVIQVPQSGQPIIQLRDAQPSGGYPKIGTVIEADIWRLGQTRIGESIRFLKVSYEEAVAALEEKQRYLMQLRQAVQLQRKANS